MLSLKDVHVKHLGIVPLLNGVSAGVASGAVVAILGPNGAGKSITLQSISGLISSELGDFTLSGIIEFDGECIVGRMPEQIVKMGIIQVMEGHRVLEELTAHENLVIGGHMCRRWNEIRKRLDRVYDYFPELIKLQKKPAGYLSGGEQQMLVIARAMMTRPKLMLLDEISFGLAPLLVDRIFSIVKKINKETGTSFLIAEQNVRAALSVTDYIYVLENGRVVFEGPAEQVKDQEDLKRFYLGM